MFIRQCDRVKNGKRPAYWPLVESYRTATGPRQNGWPGWESSMKLGDLEFNTLPVAFGGPLCNRLMLDHHSRKLHQSHRIPSQNHRTIPSNRLVVVSCESSLLTKKIRPRLSNVGWKWMLRPREWKTCGSLGSMVSAASDSRLAAGHIPRFDACQSLPITSKSY